MAQVHCSKTKSKLITYHVGYFQAVFDSLGAPKAAKAKVSPLTNRKDQAGRKSKAGDGTTHNCEQEVNICTDTLSLSSLLLSFCHATDMLLPGGLVSKQDARASHTRGLVPEVSKSPTPVRSSVSTASAAVAEDESAAGEVRRAFPIGNWHLSTVSLCV